MLVSDLIDFVSIIVDASILAKTAIYFLSYFASVLNFLLSSVRNCSASK